MFVAIVLIVDDEYFIREVAISMVEELGHVVLSANGVDDAVVHLNSVARIDVLITDVRLSAALLGGFELAQRARKLWPNCLFYT